MVTESTLRIHHHTLLNQQRVLLTTSTIQQDSTFRAIACTYRLGSELNPCSIRYQHTSPKFYFKKQFVRNSVEKFSYLVPSASRICRFVSGCVWSTSGVSFEADDWLDAGVRELIILGVGLKNINYSIISLPFPLVYTQPVKQDGLWNSMKAQYNTPLLSWLVWLFTRHISAIIWSLILKTWTMKSIVCELSFLKPSCSTD